MAANKSRNYPVRTIRILMRVLSWFPLSWMRGFAKSLAWVAWHSNARAARTTKQNIRYCYPDLSEAEQIELSKQSMYHTACAICEMPAVLRSSYPRLKKWIKSVEGEELLTQSLGNQPLLIVIPHYGNWEFCAAYLHEITDYACLYSPRRLYKLDEFILECRSRFGGEFLPVTFKGLREILRRLRDGKALIVLPDQVPLQGSAAWSKFMNRPIRTGTLVHTLVTRSDLKVVVLSAKRCERGFDIHIHDASEAIYDSDVSKSTEALDQAIEDVVGLDAAQYQWEYKRFRGAADIYQ